MTPSRLHVSGARQNRAASRSGLRIGPRNDRYEQEADRMADGVMAHRLSSPESSRFTGPPTLQRRCAKCEKEKEEEGRLQRRPSSHTETEEHAPPIVDEVLRSSGQPLEPSVRSFMSERFGHDFGRIKVHTDGRAAQSAQAVSAHAFTVGNSIVFGSNQYRPATGEGRQLIAHELAHSIQQSGGGAQTLQRRTVCDDEGVCRSEEGEDDELNYTPDVRQSSVSDAPSSPPSNLPSPVTPAVPPSIPSPPGGLAIAGAAPLLSPQPFSPPPAPVRPPLRLIPGGGGAPSPITSAPAAASRLSWLARWAGPIALGLTILLTPSETAPPWMDEINPITGQPYTGPQEYEDVRRLPPEEIRRRREEIQRERAGGSGNPSPAPSQTPQPQPQPQPAPRRTPQQECQELQPSALTCDGESMDRDRRVSQFLSREGISFSRLTCSNVGQFGPGEIDACDGAPGVRWHCVPDGRRDRTVSIFGCLCCDVDGTAKIAWRRPHWSINLSRRGR